MKNLGQYSKALVALGGVVVYLGNALMDGSLSSGESGSLLTMALVALGVYLKRNTTAE